MRKWSWYLQNKIEIRQHLLKIRAAIPNDKRLSAARDAARCLVNNAVFKSSQHIACYFSQKNEFDTGPLIEAAWAARKNCYLPILSNKGILLFAAYDQHTALTPNRFNILEPSSINIFPIEEFDMVLMPLVGFDLQGHRLGMGGGYYDKTFEFLHHKKLTKPFLLGLAFETQKMENIPTESWDISMNGVLTEKQLYIL